MIQSFRGRDGSSGGRDLSLPLNGDETDAIMTQLAGVHYVRECWCCENEANFFMN